MLIADVAVPVPLGHPFSYEVPADLRHRVGPGKRVLCAFGPRSALGVVLDVGEREIDFDPSKLKPIAAVIDEEPVLPAELLVKMPYREAVDLARDRFSRDYLVALLREFGGNVTRAAERAGMERESLHRLLKRYGVRSDDFKI